jgi:rod shape-determining protein MreB
MFLDKIIGAFSNNLAIDLGTANTVVVAKGKGIIINEPSVVAIKQKFNSMYGGFPEIVAIGNKAKDMLGKTPMNLQAVRPLKHGVISDFDIVEIMIRSFIEKAHERKNLISPMIVICVPYGLTQVERKAVIESSMNAGAREVYLVEEPLAAAIGVGIDIYEPRGRLIVDIGGGTTEIGVISLGGLVISHSLRIAGDTFDSAIVAYLKSKHNILISERVAENVKIAVGSALPLEQEELVSISGREKFDGRLTTVNISSEEIRESIQVPLKQISKAIQEILEIVPTELAGDILDTGIVLTGGGALIKKFDEFLIQEIKLPAYLAEDPLMAVAIGTGKVLEDPKLLQDVARKF